MKIISRTRTWAGGAAAVVAAAALVASCSGSSAPSWPAPVSSAVLGSVTVSLQSQRSATVAYSPQSPVAVVVSVKDTRGYTWLLTIPSGALATKATITLVPASSVRGPKDLNLTSAVTIEPAGIVFDKPATLYSQASLGSPSLVEYFHAAPKSLQFASMTKAGVDEVFGGGTVIGATRTAPVALVARALSKVLSSRAGSSKASPPQVPQIAFTCSPASASYRPQLESYLAAAQEPQRSRILELYGTYEAAVTTGAVSVASTSGAHLTSDVTRRLTGDVALLDKATKSAITAHESSGSDYLALSSLSTSVSSLSQLAAVPVSPSRDQVVSAWESALVTQHCSGR